jgi:hypothetical protein
MGRRFLTERTLQVRRKRERLVLMKPRCPSEGAGTSSESIEGKPRGERDKE